MKSISYVAGMIAGILAVVVAGKLFRHFIRQKAGANACEYDERQLAAQGSAYKWAYLTLLGCLVLGGLTELLVGQSLTTLLPFGMLCMWISICVYVSLCVFRDAYRVPALRFRTLAIVFFAGGAVNLISALTSGLPLVTEGRLDTGFVNLCTGVATLYLGVMMLVGEARERREREDEA